MKTNQKMTNLTLHASKRASKSPQFIMIVNLFIPYGRANVLLNILSIVKQGSKFGQDIEICILIVPI